MSINGVSSKPKLALIAGPTASGKSALAVAVAQRLEAAGRRAAIVNADSSQVYRDLRILSARPAPDDMGGIAHHLFGTWDGAQPCSAADWATAAKDEIAGLQAEGVLPILVGGSGLYLRTLLDGIAPIPAIDPELRAAIRAMPQAEARAQLVLADPHAAARLAPADRSRTSRALEVVQATGRTLAMWQQERTGGIGGDIDLRAAILLPPRAWLYARCNDRFAAMLGGGAQQEVATLLARCLDPTLPVMRAIGVRETAALLNGELSYADALSAGQAATRQYAKRQYTWFGHQPPADWPRICGIDCLEDTVEEILLLLRA